MSTFNAMASIVDALKVWPEPVSLPESLEDANRMQLAEARSRLQQIAQVANELRRLVDRSLAAQLAGGALRYGDTIIRPNNGRGAAKIVQHQEWWDFLAATLENCDQQTTAIFLAALYPADSVKLTGLPLLASITGWDEQTIRDTFIHYAAASSPLSVMPIEKAPGWTHRLTEGQFSGEKNNE